MALPATREVVTYLRDGTLWIGHFVVDNGELDFGDDRLDAAHGLANFAYAGPQGSKNGADEQVQASDVPTHKIAEGKTASIPSFDALLRALKLAA